MKSQIKIAFFDIDGTLASNTDMTKSIDERIPASTKLAIKKLKENGIIPMIATGRGKKSIADIVEILEMDSYISANGLSVTHEGEEVFKRILTLDQITSVLDDIIDVEDIAIMLETTEGNVVIKVSDNMRKRLKTKEEAIGYNIDKIKQYETYEIAVLGEDVKNKVKLSSEELKAKMVGPIIINIIPKEVSKATGIEKVLEIFNFDKTEAIVFGDEENDLEMFGAVSHSVAMGNAVDDLKAIATHITDTVDNDGIYKACEHFGLL